MKIHISFNIHIFSQIHKNHIFPLKIHNSTTSYSIRVGNSKWDPFSWFWNTMLRSSSYISTMPDTEWMRRQQKNKIVLWLFFQKKKWLAPKRRFFYTSSTRLLIQSAASWLTKDNIIRGSLGLGGPTEIRILKKMIKIEIRSSDQCQLENSQSRQI